MKILRTDPEKSEKEIIGVFDFSRDKRYGHRNQHPSKKMKIEKSYLYNIEYRK